MKKRSEKWINEDIPATLADRLLGKLNLETSDESLEIVKKEFDEYLIEYGRHHYYHPETKFCSLCGNGGEIDTRKTAISPKGIKTGDISWCLCANGLVLRKVDNGEEMDEFKSC